jgi:tetratricopeptide (TPR) repeat protein
MAKKKSKPRTPSTVNKDKPAYKQLSYEITYEPIIHNRYQKLPQSIQDELKDLQGKLASPLRLGRNPAILSRLEELVEQYPDMPNISNYLAAAYSVTRSPKLEAVILDNYRKHPDYLFARLHYAELCLNRNELEKIKAIFKEGYDLKLLYPHRKQFHVSEFVGFGTFICRYYLMIGERDAAELMLQLLEQAAPNNPIVQQIRHKVSDSFLSRLVGKLTASNQKKSSADESFEA